MSWSLLVSCEVLFVKRLCFHYFLLFSSFPLHLFVFFFFLVSLFHPFSFFEGVRGEVGGRSHHPSSTLRYTLWPFITTLLTATTDC